MVTFQCGRCGHSFSESRGCPSCHVFGSVTASTEAEQTLKTERDDALALAINIFDQLRKRTAQEVIEEFQDAVEEARSRLG